MKARASVSMMYQVRLANLTGHGSFATYSSTLGMSGSFRLFSSLLTTEISQPPGQIKRLSLTGQQLQRGGLADCHYMDLRENCVILSSFLLVLQPGLTMFTLPGRGPLCWLH